MARRGGPDLVAVWPCCYAGVRTVSHPRGLGDLHITWMDCTGFVAGFFGFAPRLNRQSGLCSPGNRLIRRIGYCVFYSTSTQGRTLTAMSKVTHNRLLLCLTVILVLIVAFRMLVTRNAEREVQKLEHLAQAYHNSAEACDGLGSLALKSTNVVDVVNCLRLLTPATATPRWADPPRHSDSAEWRVYDMLDRIRTLNRRAVISRLRSLTGEDLGDDSTVWITRYEKLEK